MDTNQEKNHEMQGMAARYLRGVASRLRWIPERHEETEEYWNEDFLEYRLHVTRAVGFGQVVEALQMPMDLKKRRKLANSELQARAPWALCDTEVEEVVIHFGGNPSVGLSGLAEQDLVDCWKDYMDTDLSEWWRGWLFRKNPNQEAKLYRNLCLLLKSHSEGSLSFKSAVIAQILLGVELYDILGGKDDARSYSTSRYFRGMVVSYFKWLFHKGDGNALEWLNVYEETGEDILARELVECVLDFYLYSANSEGTLSEILHILEISLLLDEISSSIVALSFGYGKVIDCLPYFVGGESSMLSIVPVTFLSYMLKSEAGEKLNWKMLYNSKCDGFSYQTFHRNVENEACTLVFIKDKENYIFGAFIDSPWSKGKMFFGGSGCFLFRLYPSLVILPSSGMNQNYSYFSYNDNLCPTGLAFGGETDAFGLHVDIETGRGVCLDSCSTYDNFERLPKCNFFQWLDMEVWKVWPQWEEKENKYGKTFDPIHIHHIL